MEPALCIEADIRGLSNGRAWKIRNSQNRCANFFRMLERGLDFSRHLQKIDGDQDILAVHKRELLQERSPAGKKNPMGIFFTRTSRKWSRYASAMEALSPMMNTLRVRQMISTLLW